MKSIVLICLMLCGLGCAGRDVIKQHREAGEAVRPLSKGVYKIKSMTIKFVPPGGWKHRARDASSDLSDPGLEFAFNEKTGPILGVLVLSSTQEQNIRNIGWLRGLKDSLIADGDQFIEEKYVPFLDTQAYTYELLTRDIRHRCFVFIKSNRIFQINFAARDNVFDVFWPMAYESMKTFKVLSLERS